MYNERIKEILNSPETIGREKLAARLALQTDLSPADAIETLSKAVADPPAVRILKNHARYTGIQNSVANTDVDTITKIDLVAERIIKNFSLATGYQH